MVNLFETVKQHPEYFKQLKCKELLFTQYECAQIDAKQDLFSEHNYIAYVISGKRVFHLPGEMHTMTEGKCVFAKKGAWIAEKEAGTGWCVLVFFIPDDYIKQFIQQSRLSLPAIAKAQAQPNQMFDLHVNNLTQNFFYSMIPYFDEQPPEELLELKFRELLLNLLINAENKALLSWLYTVADGRQSLQSVMEANYVYNLSLEDYAKIAGRSLTAFKREFKSIYQIPPGRWLISKKLEYGRMLLYFNKICKRDNIRKRI